MIFSMMIVQQGYVTSLKKQLVMTSFIPLEDPKNELPTFRQLTGEFQKGFPWYKFGVDLIMGSPGDKKASFRDKMFLPCVSAVRFIGTCNKKRGKDDTLAQGSGSGCGFRSTVPIRQISSHHRYLSFRLLLVIIIILTGLLQGKEHLTGIGYLSFYPLFDSGCNDDIL